MQEIKEKEPFEFSYTVPSLDWYRIIDVTIKPEDYYYFKIERRYGPSWWIIGSNPPRDKNKFEWTETQLGEIDKHGLKRFIEWAKDENGGSRITEINAISGTFNIIEDIQKIINN